ncbi:hypothetical protein NDU88_006765 [Pleurodeles waltl]|uniref:Uncharacterized protein n=1 Tax=Pleurodeles waltl TaxID=8319 RepID=A0AAV7VMU4_PLEWA|nr:hypothetical protein NDU88_006765 [Pleurodeles waltl]
MEKMGPLRETGFRRDASWNCVQFVDVRGGSVDLTRIRLTAREYQWIPRTRHPKPPRRGKEICSRGAQHALERQRVLRADLGTGRKHLREQGGLGMLEDHAVQEETGDAQPDHAQQTQRSPQWHLNHADSSSPY